FSSKNTFGLGSRSGRGSCRGDGNLVSLHRRAPTRGPTARRTTPAPTRTRGPHLVDFYIIVQRRYRAGIGYCIWRNDCNVLDTAVGALHSAPTDSLRAFTAAGRATIRHGLARLERASPGHAARVCQK